MDKEKSHIINFDNSKGYLVVAYKKEHECIICGKMSKFGNSHSSKKGVFNNFICHNCLEAFIRQYFKSTKTVSLSRFIKDKIAWRQKLDKAPDTKCRLCGAVIKLPQWRRHLKYCHKVGESSEFKHFFIKPNANIHTIQKKWYNSGPSIPHSVPCGTKINGGPEAKVIFNSVFSNKKKF